MSRDCNYSGRVWIYRGREPMPAANVDWRQLEADVVKDDATWEQLYWPIRETAEDLRMWDGWDGEDYVFTYHIKNPIRNCTPEDALAAFCRAATTIGKWGYYFRGKLLCVEEGQNTISRLFIDHQYARLYELEEGFPIFGDPCPTSEYTPVKEVRLEGNVDPNGRLANDPPPTKRAKPDVFDDFSMKHFNIYVHSERHMQTVKLSVFPLMKVEELKQLIAQKLSGIHVEQMVLFYAGTPLEDGRSLGAAYRVRPEDTIRLESAVRRA